MKKVDELTYKDVIDIIKAYYARHGRNWDDFVYEPKVNHNDVFKGIDLKNSYMEKEEICSQ